MTSPAVRSALRAFGPALALLLLQLVMFPVGAGVVLQGVILGLLSAMVAVGLALVYRTNRIINFAQGELGAAPAALAVLLVLYSGWNYWVAGALGLVAAAVVGAVVEFAFVRRFFHASRLILTAATLGISQLLLLASVALPLLWDEKARPVRLEPPFDLTFTVDPLVFDANDVLAVVIAPIAMLVVAGVLRFTTLGIAMRASADNVSRAALLGIPVKGVQTIVWAMAAVLAFVGIFLRAGVFGLPIFFTLTVGTMLRALAALVLGRMTNLPAVAASATAIGVLEAAIFWDTSSTQLLDPILAVIIVAGMLLLRRGSTRAEQTEATSWSLADEIRPYPGELVGLPEVRLTRGAWWGAIGLVALVVPHYLSTSQSLRLSSVVVYAMIVMSLVVLTGWAGQMSLGQMGFVLVGAAVGAKLTTTWNVDITLALLASGMIGGLIAVVVGLPALRLRGLQLAVVTLGFALAVSSYLVNPEYFDWVPRGQVARLPILGIVDWETPTRLYYVCLAVFVFTAWVVRGLRTSRTGRVILALRENERATQSFGVSIVRTKLLAFAISGSMAAMAGALFVHHQHALDLGAGGPYASFENINVFIAAVIGGLGSLTGAVMGAVFLRGGYLYLSGTWRLLVSAIGVLALLLISPGGLGGLLFRARDGWLRFVARERGLDVPSLVAGDASDLDDGATAEEEEAAAEGRAPSQEPVP